jgi:hypothetical protein
MTKTPLCIVLKLSVSEHGCAAWNSNILNKSGRNRGTEYAGKAGGKGRVEKEKLAVENLLTKPKTLEQDC